MHQTTSKGDCECCTRTDVMLRLSKTGNMMQCEVCREADEATRTINAKNVVEFSRKIDTQIELKQDVFNAATVSFVELQSAIDNNSEIPADKKSYALMQEVAARIDKLSSVIFADEQALVAKRNERHALLVNAQNVAARLHAVEREKFKQYDVNYKPVTPKSVKPKTVNKKSFDKTAVFEAAKKYNVPAAQVQSVVTSRNMSPEDAAKHMAQLLGLI